MRRAYGALSDSELLSYGACIMHTAYRDQRREMGWIPYGIRPAATGSAHYLSMETYTGTPC